MEELNFFTTQDSNGEKKGSSKDLGAESVIERVQSFSRVEDVQGDDLSDVLGASFEKNGVVSGNGVSVGNQASHSSIKKGFVDEKFDETEGEFEKNFNQKPRSSLENFSIDLDYSEALQDAINNTAEDVKLEKIQKNLGHEVLKEQAKATREVTPLYDEVSDSQLKQKIENATDDKDLDDVLTEQQPECKEDEKISSHSSRVSSFVDDFYNARNLREAASVIGDAALYGLETLGLSEKVGPVVSVVSDYANKAFCKLRSRKVQKLANEGRRVYSDDFVFVQINQDMMVLSYVGSSSVIKVPSRVGGLPVKYLHQDFLTGKYGGKTVKCIKDALSKDSVMNSVSRDLHSVVKGPSAVLLPNTLEVIFAKTFYGCRDVKYLVIPKSVRLVEQNAFYQSGIQNIYFNGEVPNGFRMKDYAGINVYCKSEFLQQFKVC